MKSKGFNNYKIIGNIVEIYIARRNGDNFKVLIDKDDLQKLINLDYSWSLYWDYSAKTYYCNTTFYRGIIDGVAKYATLKLNRLLMQCKDDEYIDHINNNTLDNRKENLRIVNRSQNGKNRKGKNCNNKSGYRNVSLNGKKWIVQLQIDGKNVVLAKFDNVDDAGVYAEKMRKEYYGTYAGKGA